MNNRIGITEINKRTIDIKGNDKIVTAVKQLSKFGLITFSRLVQFKSTEYSIHFFKPTDELKNMYSLGNELLIICCTDAMNDFKSRTKDFIDYMLVTNREFKNRLDKVTCILIDGNNDILDIIKRDRATNPDSRLIVPFSIEELQSCITADFFHDRLRTFLYEKDLFGIAVPLRDDTLFFGKDRTKVISELYARYKQGEEGGLFGLRRIGKTSILNLLKLRIAESDGVAIYFDCSSCHHYRWNELLLHIVNTIINEYSVEKNENGNISFAENIDIELVDERYSEKRAAESFSQDIHCLYESLGKKRILLILDEIESIGFSTSPSEWWKRQNDALFFWQTIRSLIQTHSEYLAFVVAGVNPMCVELQSINGYDNPIFGMFSPIYISLFEYDDVKKMVSSIGARLGLFFEEPVYAKLMEDYGGHPFLVRQVCSRINNELAERNQKRPITITRNAYDARRDEYNQSMTSVIEQILGVIEKYYSNEFGLLKCLALDGRSAFKKEIALGEKGIQHLLGYCLIEKENGEYFIRIKSIADYLKSKFVYDSTLNSQKDKRARINIRRDEIEEKLRNLIMNSLKLKYGKKAKQQLVEIIKKTSTDEKQEQKIINASSLSNAMEELYFFQLGIIMEKDWKCYQNIFPDKTKFEIYMDILNRSRKDGAHTRSVSAEDEALYGLAFEYFENILLDE